MSPVTNFLDTIAKEIDLSVPFVVDNPEYTAIADWQEGTPRPDFNPVRRKLDMHLAK